MRAAPCAVGARRGALRHVAGRFLARVALAGQLDIQGGGNWHHSGAELHTLTWRMSPCLMAFAVSCLLDDDLSGPPPPIVSSAAAFGCARQVSCCCVLPVRGRRLRCERWRVLRAKCGEVVLMMTGRHQRCTASRDAGDPASAPPRATTRSPQATTSHAPLRPLWGGTCQRAASISALRAGDEARGASYDPCALLLTHLASTCTRHVASHRARWGAGGGMLGGERGVRRADEGVPVDGGAWPRPPRGGFRLGRHASAHSMRAWCKTSIVRAARTAPGPAHSAWPLAAYLTNLVSSCAQLG